MAEPPKPIAQLKFTPTVDEALKQLADDTAVSASKLAQTILNLYDHKRYYAGGMFVSLTLQETDLKKPAQKWLEEVQTLFDPEALVANGYQPELHGRLAIVGLAILDTKLYEQLEQHQAFTALVKELRPPLKSLTDILSDRGRKLYDEVVKPTPREVADTVPNWSDDPLKKLDEDQLGREAYARFLAERIKAIPSGSGAYTIHLYGPWGAGKSTLLNFLQAELTAEGAETYPPTKIPQKQDSSKEVSTKQQRWLIVEFNAWRNQHIDPPWWSLIDTVFRHTKGELSWLNRMWEYEWRLFSGRVSYLFSLAVLMWVLVLGGGWVLQYAIGKEDRPGRESLAQVASTAENVGKIVALVVTIWSGIEATKRSLLLGSAEAAATYKQRVNDPMNEIEQRFNKLIERLAPRRVAVFIDDLDRCQSSYVVELLEGIQTLFREAPIVYVVAADRHWLNACYVQEYDKLEPFIHEPGKSLGTLFLEKAFRFSTPIPGIPDEIRKQYWSYLLQLKTEEKDLNKARQKAKEEVSKISGEGDLQHLATRKDESKSFVEQQAIREEVAMRLAAPEVMERLEHTLKPYSSLLDPNPRAMKLLVNAYSANWAISLLSRIDVERHQLILWTILSERWPDLASFLEEHPKMVNRFRPGNSLDVDKDFEALLSDRERETLKVLFSDKDVIDVVNAKGIDDIPLGPALHEEAIKLCSLMHA
ncbi:P-loop NTPase fold protein [Pseudanabaena sp. PCC 6802]|uniref:KAP family P-loop NTPase fold protein n=1 Tax=Pseudanabaena sp. PCC 6802 TaxID=118173 RepID=UPI000345F45E|nr:P-loop NTPase fold protein [Pseudanabaena sp. PCC 6802]